jgi:hypothetical protein
MVRHGCLSFSACGSLSVSGQTSYTAHLTVPMFDAAFVPKRPVVASWTASLDVEPAGSMAIAVAHWSPG